MQEASEQLSQQPVKPQHVKNDEVKIKKKEETLRMSVINTGGSMQFLDEDCRATKPRETQLLSREYYCLLHTNNTVQCTRDDLVLTNSNFIDSGASINAVSPEFCLRAGLEAKIRDHGTMMPITLANKQEMTVPARTVRLHLFIESFDPYVGDFLILPVPKTRTFCSGCRG